MRLNIFLLIFVSLLIGSHTRASSLTRVDGTLRKLSEKDLFLQTDGSSVLRLRLLAKTQFHDPQGAQIRDSLLHPGDQLSVLVDPDDPETAVQVVLVRTGTAAERESAEKPIAEGSFRVPEQKDLRIDPATPTTATRQTETQADTDAAILADARSAAFEYDKSLTDFIAEQVTTRYTSERWPPAWKKNDVITATVVYAQGKEEYQDVKVNGRTPRVPFEQTGSWSNGEFGTLLVDVMHPQTAAAFKRRGEESIVSRPAAVFDFTVAQSNSHWSVVGGASRYTPAYEGAIWIDKDTRRVLRVEMRAISIPPDFPLRKVDQTLEYGFVNMDEGTYLLPASAEVLACESGNGACSRNSLTFRNYRKSGSSPDSGKDPDPQEIIRRFTANESENSHARDTYTFRQILRIAELDPSGNPQGRYEAVEDLTFTPDGTRSSHVVGEPRSTLRHLLLTPQDQQDLGSVQSFFLTTDQIPHYNITYLGRQKLKDVGCFAFSVKPRKLEKGKRYFEGQIWVDDVGLQIVKTSGKGVGIVRSGNEFPRFETYREQIDGKYWFPTSSNADDVLHFPKYDQRISMTVEYQDYKPFDRQK